ncbi:AAA family ATPase [Mycolicibacterium fortuitum]|nr:AAA family ATPase [Mycolicibacterium fortuitum]
MTGLSTHDAALALADAGLWLLPVAVGKSPGSVVGKDWPAKSTRDPELIDHYWNRPQPYGVAIHTGRSGLVVVDLDIDVLPEEFAWLRDGLFQSSRGGRGDRGHYIFASAETFRNVQVRLQDGTHIGEIKSGNSVILVEPSPHPKAAEGGKYAFVRTGVVPSLPEHAHPALVEIAAKAGGDDGPVSNDLVADWCERHSDETESWRRKTLRDDYAKRVARGQSRHAAMMAVLNWAAREIAPGFVAASVLHELHDDFVASYRATGDVPDRGDFANMVRSAVGKVAPADESPAMMADLLSRGRREFGTNHNDDARAARELDGWLSRLKTESDDMTTTTVNGAPTVNGQAPEQVTNDDAVAGKNRSDGNDGEPSSWSPVDLRAARTARGQLKPTIGRRGDGAHLFYPGKVHSVHGESESGKSWFALCVAAECLLSNRPVLFVDFEDDGAEVANRLLLLGVPESVVDDPQLFTYARPEVEPKTDQDVEAFARLLSRRFDFAVIDGVTESMTMFGLVGKDNDDVAKWQRKLPKAIARHTGAAVVCVDHVTKDADSRGRFALGGQHKMAGLDGAAFIIEPETPFARGLAGSASVRIGKDRHGCLRGIGGKYQPKDRTQPVATFRLDSTDTARAVWALDAPADVDKAGQVERVTSARKQVLDAKAAEKVATRKWCMEQISRRLESTDLLLEERSGRKIVETLWKAQQKSTDSGARTVARNTWRDALTALDNREFVTHSGDEKTGFAYASVKPYRADDDKTDDGVFGWVARPDVEPTKPPKSGESDGSETAK